MYDKSEIQSCPEGHVHGCPGSLGGDHEWDGEHSDWHDELVEGCSECENRAERSAERWSRAMSSY